MPKYRCVGCGQGIFASDKFNKIIGMKIVENYRLNENICILSREPILKTLEELEIVPRNSPFSRVLISELKEEAIKWIKNGTYMTKKMSSETKEFIKYFFNLTEEDLK